VAGARQASRQLQQQRRLADPGIAPEQHDRAGDEASTEDTVDLAHTGRQALCLRARHTADGFDRRRRRAPGA